MSIRNVCQADRFSISNNACGGNMFGIKTFIKSHFNRYFFYPHVWQKILDKRVETLRQKDCITVAFVTMDVAMWKYQGLYDLLKQDRRFNTYIVLSPTVKFCRDEMARELQKMREFFGQRAMPYVDWDLEHGAPPTDIRKTLNPDILFYTQPGKKVFTSVHSFQHFRNKLLCYSPYGFYMHDKPSLYDRKFLNMAWKLYYFTDVQKSLAEKYAERRGENVIVSGYPPYEQYTNGPFSDVWKIKDKSVKRIVWAPHFTISTSLMEGTRARSHFLTMWEMMPKLAKKYEGKIQIAFKPHPRLLTELYQHPDWGKERADNYYSMWQQHIDNGQLETGEFVSLFHSSDALIHDSSSFLIDYVYFDKPEFFLADDLTSYKLESDEVSLKVYNSVYYGLKEQEICHFIEDVVIGGNDTMKETRNAVFRQHLLPPGGKIASQIIYEDLKRDLSPKS